jgi:hypothetical protein
MSMAPVQRDRSRGRFDEVVSIVRSVRVACRATAMLPLERSAPRDSKRFMIST